MDENPSETLIASLQDPALYDHPVAGFEVLETHISWVILTGDFAYKIKKPVRFGFLDFSTLELRRYYCEEELRLNRRYAPDLYLAVVAITGDVRRPELGGSGEPVEYAVQMKQFPSDALLSRLVERGELRAAHVDAMAEEVAVFHDGAERAAPDTSRGAPEQVQQWALENFDEIRPLLSDRDDGRCLDELHAWTEEEYRRRRPLLQERKRDGGIRECHGDLHLGNMFLQEARIRLFDCIEFNEELRWIDVMNEAAFIVMDLRDRGQQRFAARFLNHYLQHTGDYAGLGVLAYYCVYRALVRAKVTLLRLAQGHPGAEQEAAVWRDYRAYIDLALATCRRPRPLLLITHGVSGSGKSHLAAPLSELLGAVHLRSDIERKRLHGYAGEARTGSALQSGIYSPEDTARTYARLEAAAAAALDGGCPVIVDATFLKREQRRQFRELARRAGAGFVILDFRAPETLLRDRVRERLRDRTDASEADEQVLEMQQRQREPLDGTEARAAVSIDSAAAPDAEAVSRRVRRRNGNSPDPSQ